jgi:hypothetical protein
MKDVISIRREIKDSRIERLVEEGTVIANDPNAKSICIEIMMRKIFFCPYSSPELVEVYNKLEYNWKLLVNYKINETHVI